VGVIGTLLVDSPDCFAERSSIADASHRCSLVQERRPQAAYAPGRSTTC